MRRVKDSLKFVIFNIRLHLWYHKLKHSLWLMVCYTIYIIYSTSSVIRLFIVLSAHTIIEKKIFWCLLYNISNSAYIFVQLYVESGVFFYSSTTAIHIVDDIFFSHSTSHTWSLIARHMLFQSFKKNKKWMEAGKYPGATAEATTTMNTSCIAWFNINCSWTKIICAVIC